MALDWVGEGGSSIVGWVGLFIVGSGIGYLWGWGGVEYRGKTTSGAKQPVCVCVGGGATTTPPLLLEAGATLIKICLLHRLGLSIKFFSLNPPC